MVTLLEFFLSSFSQGLKESARRPNQLGGGESLRLYPNEPASVVLMLRLVARRVLARWVLSSRLPVKTYGRVLV